MSRHGYQRFSRLGSNPFLSICSSSVHARFSHLAIHLREQDAPTPGNFFKSEMHSPTGAFASPYADTETQPVLTEKLANRLMKENTFFNSYSARFSYRIVFLAASHRNCSEFKILSNQKDFKK